MQTSNVISAHRPGAHHLQHAGLGYSRPLENEDLARIAQAKKPAPAKAKPAPQPAHNVWYHFSQQKARAATRALPRGTK